MLLRDWENTAPGGPSPRGIQTLWRRRTQGRGVTHRSQEKAVKAAAKMLFPGRALAEQSELNWE